MKKQISESKQYKCNQQDHQDNIINYACLSLECQQYRIGCLQCMQQYHNDHPTMLYKLSALNSLVLSFKNQNLKYINLIESTIMKKFATLINFREEIINDNKIFTISQQLSQQNELIRLIELTMKYNKGEYKLLYQKIDEELLKIEKFIQNKDTNQLNNEKKQEEIQVLDQKQQENLNNQKIEDKQIIIQQKKINKESIQDMKRKLEYFMQNSNYRDALVQVQKLLKKEPNQLYYLKILGNIYFRLQKYKDAIPVYDNILQQVPQDMLQFVNKMSVLVELGQYQEVLQQVDQKIIIYPDNLDLYECKGECLMHMNDFQQALLQFLQIDQYLPQVQIKNRIGQCYQALGDFQTAISYYKEIQQLDKNLGQQCQLKIKELEKQL